jgi:hypothetical protein
LGAYRTPAALRSASNRTCVSRGLFVYVGLDPRRGFLGRSEGAFRDQAFSPNPFRISAGCLRGSLIEVRSGALDFGSCLQPFGIVKRLVFGVAQTFDEWRRLVLKAERASQGSLEVHGCETGCPDSERRDCGLRRFAARRRNRSASGQGEKHQPTVPCAVRLRLTICAWPVPAMTYRHELVLPNALKHCSSIK